MVGGQLRPAPCSVADHAGIERVGRHHGRPPARKARHQGLQHHEHDNDRNQRAPAVPQLVQEAWCHENAVMEPLAPEPSML